MKGIRLLFYRLFAAIYYFWKRNTDPSWRSDHGTAPCHYCGGKHTEPIKLYCASRMPSKMGEQNVAAEADLQWKCVDQHHFGSFIHGFFKLLPWVFLVVVDKVKD